MLLLLLLLLLLAACISCLPVACCHSPGLNKSSMCRPAASSC
jgi:hypothetical protein